MKRKRSRASSGISTKEADRRMLTAYSSEADPSVGTSQLCVPSTWSLCDAQVLIKRLRNDTPFCKVLLGASVLNTEIL